MKFEGLNHGRERKGGLTKESRAQTWRRHGGPRSPGPEAIRVFTGRPAFSSQFSGARSVSSHLISDSQVCRSNQGNHYGTFFFFGLEYITVSQKSPICGVSLSRKLWFLPSTFPLQTTEALCDLMKPNHPSLVFLWRRKSSGLFMTSEKQFPRWLFHGISFPHKFFTGRTI